MESGNAFFAPHLLYPSILDDAVSSERQLGIDMGLAMLSKCDELWVFGPRISAGMQAEMEEAERIGIPIRRMEISEDMLETPGMTMMGQESV